MEKYLTCPEYEELKKNYICGWKTWNVHSVFSYVHFPDGFSLQLCFKEYRDGNFLRDALIGRFPSDDPEDATEILSPGDHAADDSYTAMKMEWCGTEILVETASDEDHLAVLVTPIKQQLIPVSLYLQGGYMWNRGGRVQHGTDNMHAFSACNGRERWVIEVSGSDERKRSGTDKAPDLNVPLTGPFLTASLSGQAGFLAKRIPDFGETEERDILKQVRELVEDKKQHLDRTYGHYGELAWMARAMECAVSWDTVYDANLNRVISPVSRLWSIRKGGYVLFCWDNFFAGYMAGWFCKALAYSNVIEIVNERTQKGFIPNMSCGNGMKTNDRSQPPVGSAMVLELYRRFEDLWLVRLLYPALLEWNTWFFGNRRAASGALCWGSDPAQVITGNRWETDGVYERFGGALESGLDNSPMYDDIPFDPQTRCLMLEDAGLTGLYLMDCSSLQELASLLGKEEDIRILQERKNTVSAALEELWDEENGFYYNRRTDTGEFSRRISPTNFYPLYADDLPVQRLERIVKEHYFDPEEFYGEWMLPSIARNDPAYKDQDYWRGRVWAPLNFLVYRAFKHQGLTEACSDLAKRSQAVFSPEWEQHRHVHENYNAVTGMGCDAHNSDKFYHWGALLSAIVLKEKGF